MFTIEAENISKIYESAPFSKTKGVPALKSISLKIAPQTIYTLLGPNGAGKSTLIRILGALLQPTSGEVRVCGKSFRDPSFVASKIGISIPGSNGFFEFLTLHENFYVFSALYRMDETATRQRIGFLTERFGLQPILGKQFRRLSSGQRQRANLARALLHDPEVLLLDEPTAHLDPYVRRDFHKLLRDLVTQDLKKTIIFTTHQLDEALEISNRLGFIFAGSMIWERDPDYFQTNRHNLLEEYLNTIHAQTSPNHRP
jgi:ABC-type multidrug transport system ATPase subunit